MTDTRRQLKEPLRLDTKELDYPETLYVRDIENKVFQAIVLECLSKVNDISLIEGSFIDNIFTRGLEGVKGISAEQDGKNQTVKIRVEVNIAYGVSIPSKAEEIQTKITEEVTKLTGLHVACVHVVFKGLVHSQPAEKAQNDHETKPKPHQVLNDPLDEEYSSELK